jgi:hypothetical protein
MKMTDIYVVQLCGVDGPNIIEEIAYTDENAAKLVADCLNWKLTLKKDRIKEAVERGHDVYGGCSYDKCPICDGFNEIDDKQFYVVRKVQLNDISAIKLAMEAYDEC